MTTRQSVHVFMAVVAAMALGWASTAWAAPGGLPKCQADLATCQDDLAACEAQPCPVFPGDGAGNGPR
jgi:hypothetical protein